MDWQTRGVPYLGVGILGDPLHGVTPRCEQLGADLVLVAARAQPEFRLDALKVHAHHLRPATRIG